MDDGDTGVKRRVASEAKVDVFIASLRALICIKFNADIKTKSKEPVRGLAETSGLRSSMIFVTRVFFALVKSKTCI